MFSDRDQRSRLMPTISRRNPGRDLLAHRVEAVGQQGHRRGAAHAGGENPQQAKGKQLPQLPSLHPCGVKPSLCTSPLLLGFPSRANSPHTWLEPHMGGTLIPS